MQNFKSLQQALTDLTPQGALVELSVLAGSLLVAYGLVWLLHRGAPRGGRSIWFGARRYDGVLFPLAALLAGVIARWGLKDVVPVGLLRLAVPILISLVVIRLSVQVLRTAFPASLLVRRLERTVSWLVWGGLVLWLTGALPFLMDEMEAVQWRIGGASVSLLMMMQGALSAGAVLLLVLWLSATIESQLLKGAVGSSISARKMAANATRAMLLVIGVLVALTAVGIPISALSVLGGAIGVGIGLGLQKLAANYVSGFVVLAEHSLRIGDLVRVDNFEGHITDIKTRYTVIRALSGRESIVPNEMLITQRVENLSLADRNVLVSTVVQVAYGTDLDALMPELVAVARAVPRVLSDPGPGVQLSNFASDGLELTLLFWISDPENGQGNVRSAVNLAVLQHAERARHRDPLSAAGAARPACRRSAREQRVGLRRLLARRHPSGRRLTGRAQRLQVHIDRLAVGLAHGLHVEPGHRRPRPHRGHVLQPLGLRHVAHEQPQVGRIAGAPGPAPPQRLAGEPQLLVDLAGGLHVAGCVAVVAAGDLHQVATARHQGLVAVMERLCLGDSLQQQQ
jgi:small-conductance mechanosensitive channel